jgi:hypothetical protein
MSSSGSGKGSAEPVEGWFEGAPGHPAMRTASTFSVSGSSSSSSDFVSESETESWTEVPVWVPIPIRELSSESVWSREEKLSKIVELLKFQQQRHAFIKLGTERTQPLLVPFVKDPRLGRETLTEYVRAIHERQGALTGQEADRILAAKEQQLLERARQHQLPVAADIRPGPKTPLTRKRP